MRTGILLVAAFALQAAAIAGVPAKESLKPWTVAEEIGLVDFPIVGSISDPVIVSPNGRFVAVWSERGLLNADRVEDDLRVYDLDAVERFLRNARRHVLLPSPVLDLRKATFVQGPIISQVRWLPDSRGLAFLLRTVHDRDELMVMDLKRSRPEALSVKGQDVTAFSVRDKSHYVYAVASLGSVLPIPWSDEGIVWDGTGQSLENILLRGDLKRRLIDFGICYGGRLKSVLWAANGGKPHALLHADGDEVVIYPTQGGVLALAPNGHTLATALPVQDVPTSWAREFQPPFANDPYDMMRAGPQDFDVAVGDMFVATEYVLIDLRNGVIRPVTRGPTGAAVGWWTLSDPVWSHDGKGLLLPDVYVPFRHGQSITAGPCVGMFYPRTERLECIKALRIEGSPDASGNHKNSGFIVVSSLRFAGSGTDKAVVRYYGLTNTLGYTGTARETFVRSFRGVWFDAGALAVRAADQVSQPQQRAIDVRITQGLNDPPVLVAEDRRTGVTGEIWDPNPDLKHVRVGKAEVYHWRNGVGRLWTGGLYRPARYVSGTRYPLVIQTHGFPGNVFRPSGWAPTAFAARALAASGMVVLQVPECLHVQDPQFGPCEMGMYDAAVKQLAAQGLVDPNRVGLIGFSQTVFPVLEALTNGGVRFAAASITDGPSWGYWEYLSSVDSERNEYSRVADATIGAVPFGAGLRVWQNHAPDFNMEHVHTPLLVTSLGRTSLFEGMWEPYAVLRSLHKPVDLILLRSDEHVLTRPTVRLASQGGSVDWFSFWLQGRESMHAVMAGEYPRWEKLCDVQREENPGQPTWCVSTKRRVSTARRIFDN